MHSRCFKAQRECILSLSSSQLLSNHNGTNPMVKVGFTSLQEKNTQTSRKIQQHVIFILVGWHVRHFSEEISVSNVKKINHGLLLCQNKRERCLNYCYN
jgi:hypothetical protein